MGEGGGQVGSGRCIASYLITTTNTLTQQACELCLQGHTLGNRLEINAGRPAPTQVSEWVWFWFAFSVCCVSTATNMPLYCYSLLLIVAPRACDIC